MNHGHPLLESHQIPDIHTDWSSICDELQTQLPAELVEITGNRLRIEAAIAKLDIGDVLRHLCIHVLTPGQKKEIVRFELNSQPSEAVASTLAAIIAKAKDKDTPAEDVIGSLRECLESSGPYYFKKLAPEKNPFVQPTMERNIPDFEKFARDPRSMDTLFSVEREVNGKLVRAIATLYPEHRYTLIEAFTYPQDANQTPQVVRFKARCCDKFWERPRTSPEIIAALHSATWSAMDTIVSDGVEQASKALTQSEIDQRLYVGDVQPAMCDTVHVLPSGARVLVEEGDKLVCVRVESSADEDATSFFWRITSPDGLLLPSDTRLITARSAAESLAAADPHRRRAAIQTLDRLEHGSPNRLPHEARKIFPFETQTLSEIAGLSVIEELSKTSRAISSVVKPNSEALVLDLLDGFHSIKLAFRDPGYNRRNPQDPDTLFLAFRPDGALKVTITTPLRTHLETLIPADYFERHEPIEVTVRRLAALFDKQTSSGFFELRREIERLDAFNDGETYASSLFRPALTRFPSVLKAALNRSLDTAAEMALVYEADVPASISEVQMLFDDPTCCEMVVSNTLATTPVRIHLQVSEFGVHSIDLYSIRGTSQTRYPFSLGSPLALPEGREVLTGLFRLLSSLPCGGTKAQLAVAAPITTTPLFKYLQECQTRFAAR